jgi:Domain of unknown function (DUF5666)
MNQRSGKLFRSWQLSCVPVSLLPLTCQGAIKHNGDREPSTMVEDEMRKFLTMIVVALAVSVTSCGKRDSESPLVPSASAASGGAIAGSASISGTVVSGASSASLQSTGNPLAVPMGSGLVVSIVGTAMSVTVDSTGHFTLTNVPSGDLTLAFVGSGINARVTISGVSDRDQIRITVNVHGSSAELDENEHQRAGNQTELEGRVASKNCAANQMTVGMTTPIVVNLMGARIRHDGNTLACADIQLNDRVEVHGTRNGDTINATDVNVKTDHGVPPVRNEVELKGRISLLAGTCPSLTFTVSSTKVTTSAATKFDESACTALHNGDAVEVKGAKQTDGRVLASRVEKEDDDEDDNNDDEDEDDEKDEAEIRGIVTGAASGHACPAFTFTVGSTSVTTSARTKFEHTTCAAVINGISVKVEGTRTSPTAIAASEVEKR